MSSISTLIEASSSAAVLLGFFMMEARGRYARGSEIQSNDDGVRPSNLNTFLTPLFDPGIFLRSVFARSETGGLSMLPGGRFCASRLIPTSEPCPTRLWHAADRGRFNHASEASHEG